MGNDKPEDIGSLPLLMFSLNRTGGEGFSLIRKGGEGTGNTTRTTGYAENI